MENPLKTLWAEGKPVLNGWCSIGSAHTAEIMARQGYDSLTVDTQHGAFDYGAALSMLQAMGGKKVVPLARVPWLDAGAIMKLLDAGAMGIICPMINTAEDAAAFASYLRYPPHGQRSFGPTRAGLAYPGYGVAANDAVLGFAMIETQAGLDNVEAIAATPGIDGLYVGPADLTLGLSQGALPAGFDRDEPEIVAAIKRIAQVALDAGKIPALHCMSPEYAAKALDWGFRMVTLNGDARLLAAASGASVAAFRALQNDA
ncbi:HpcH/HpaI aldolase family protein [Oceaniglobus indicus]|uniref:HpcH/HpaI aldolase family protein n=1 Tax=Oceaniglobus indicus TaxID=2047749 RepID=UPI000C1984FD|nr:aldolase/citrate lyase family protein [Oceaniglobus indicus]